MAINNLEINSTLLGGKYRIEAILGQGGFGITYLAVHTVLGKKVAIKEFFPKEYCDREGNTSHITLGTQSNREFVDQLKNKFIKEAKNISKFDHKNIISIMDIFEENNTAYYVMDYIDGASLEEIVSRDGAMLPERAVGYMREVAGALRRMHASHMMHLDIKPANIMVRHSDGRPILIDFGLSKNFSQSGSATSCTPHGVSHGYSPLEQYNPDGVSTFSPQTDIYSFGATLYKLVTGNTPSEATKRLEEPLTFPEEMTPSMRSFIEECMQLSKSKRPANIDKVLDMLETVDTTPPVVAEEEITSDESVSDEGGAGGGIGDSKTKVIQGGAAPIPSKGSPKKDKPAAKKKSKTPILIIVALIAAACVGAAIYFATLNKGPKTDADSPIVSDSEQPIAPKPAEDSAAADTAVAVPATQEPASTSEADKKAQEAKKKEEERKKKEEEERRRLQEQQAQAEATASPVRSAAARVGRANIEAGMDVTGASVQGNALVFRVSVSNKLYDASDFNNTAVFTNAMRGYAAGDANAAAAIAAAKKAKMNVRFVFSGASTKTFSY